MKKIILIIGVLLILIGVIIKFSENNKSEVNKEDIAVSNSIIELKMAHNLPENSALHEASVLFAKKVKEKTKSKVNITIYPKQTLGNDHKMVELARDSKIDILLTPTAKMSVIIPSMQYADLPFLFPTREDAYELLDGEVGQTILKDLNKIDLLGVTFWENGFKHFTANTALLSPEDFDDKKIRIMKSRIIEEQFKALGAQAIPIDFHSTKKALLDGVVDGQENPLVAIVNMGFHEAQTDLTLSEHAYLPYVFSISKKTLTKLSMNEQDILISTAKEVTSWEREETQRREKEFLDIVEKSGTNIHTLTAEQKNRFANKTKYISKMYEDVIGTDIISKTEEILYKKYNKDKVLVIGLNADLSMNSKGSGLAIKRGVELAVDEINKEGGLLGKELIVIAKNHKAISTQAVQNIKEFIDDSNVLGVIGGKHSAIISSELETIHSGKIPYISPWAAASKIIDNGYKDNYMFRVSANDNFLISKLWSETVKNSKKPLVLVENSIWGRGGLNIIKGLSLNSGIDNLDSITINRGEKDFKKIVEYIKANGIDSILMVLNSHEGSSVISDLSKAGINLPVISHWGIVGDEFYKSNKEALKSLDLKFIQTFSFFDNISSNAKRVASSYINKYGISSISEINAPSGVAQAYDATKLLVMAVKKANSLNRDKIKEQLESIEYYDGLIKEYKRPFTKDEHEALDEEDFFFARYSENGQIIPIK